MTRTDIAPASIDDVPGWFWWTDQKLFEHFLSEDAVVPRGDLVELGAYLGKSAVLIGAYLGEDETFTVCDLFGSDSDDEANRLENNHSYATLDRLAFERNYRAFHDRPATVVQAPSSTILDHVAAGSVRFVHVDASHLYDHVRVDVASARTMLAPEGVVVFDDFRSAHTPGVSAAVWEAVVNDGLHPICVTSQKLYATFGDIAPHQERLAAWVERTPRAKASVQSVLGAPLPQVWIDKAAAPAVPADPIELVHRRLGELDDRITRQAEHLDSRFAKVERLIGRLPRPEPDLATKVVRRVRSARRRAQR
jgi:hypothetical protein